MLLDRGALKLATAVGCLVGGLGACGSRNLAPGGGGAAVPGSGGGGGAGGAGGDRPVVTTGGSSGAPALGTGGGGGSVVIEGCAGGATFEYVVRALVAGERGVDGSVGAHGFDLDGRVSDGTVPQDCGVADSVSPDGRAGIDNVIGGLWTEDFSVAFKRSYEFGSQPMLVRLGGVDSLDQDDCVDVEWFPGDGPLPPVFDASGRLAPGQSYRHGGAAGRIPKARIEAGRVTATGEIPVTLGATYFVDDGTQRGFNFSFALTRITFAASAEALTGGELGGRMQPADVQAAYRSAYGSLISPDQVSAVLFPDLPSSGSSCGLLSVGFGFDAVSATVIP